MSLDKLITCGEFTYDPVDGVLSGPAEYMHAQGNAKLDRMLEGDDLVFNITASKAPSVEQAMLSALQHDYAGWHGIQRFLRVLDTSE